METEITELLAEMNRGDSEALNRIVAALYCDLRRLAHARLRGHGEAPTLLDTTSLVHECYMRFLNTGDIHISDRGHFLAYAARIMRSIVVDFVRQRSALCRGGGGPRITFDGPMAEMLSAGE